MKTIELFGRPVRAIEMEGKTYAVVNPHFADEEIVRFSMQAHAMGQPVLWVRTDPIEGTEVFGSPTKRNLPLFQ